MELCLYRAEDCRALYTELKNLVLHYLINTPRFYVYQSNEETNYQNARHLDPPLNNHIHGRSFRIIFTDHDEGMASTRHDLLIRNQKEGVNDSIFITDNIGSQLSCAFKIADPMIAHNIPHYLKLFIDLPGEDYLQRAMDEQRERYYALTASDHARLGANSGLLSEVMRAGLFDHIGRHAGLSLKRP